MKVRATQLGVYGLKRMREGAVFDIDSEKEFSERWMEKVDGRKKRKVVDEDSENGDEESQVL
jgi:hypothetical protein